MPSPPFIKTVLNRLFIRKEGTLSVAASGALFAMLMSASVAVELVYLLRTKQHMQNALDAAVLAGASAKSTDAGVVDAVASSVFAQGGFIDENQPDSRIDTYQVIDNAIHGKATYQSPSVMMRIFGTNYISLSVESVAAGSAKGIELALVLDVSSSMEDGNKIQQLRDAAGELIDGLYGTANERPDTAVAIIPFDGRVNTSSYNSTWIDMSLVPKGAGSKPSCTGLRSEKNRLSDLSFSKEAFPPYLTGKNYGSSSTCGGSPVVGWKTGKADLMAAVKHLRTGYGTSIWEGAAWGFRMLSPTWKGHWGSPDYPLPYEETPGKIMVLMTDGENTPKDYGDPFTTTEANRMQVSICSQMKKMGITIYTVGFDIGLAASQPLKDCATSSSHFFASTKSQGLSAAFKAIHAGIKGGGVRLIR